MQPILLVLLLQLLSTPQDPPADAPVPAPSAAAPATAAGPSAASTPAAPTSPEAAALQRDLLRLIGSPGWRNDRWSVMVVSLDRGDTLFAYHADEALAPASNMKLFTSAAALYYLGPDFRFNTYLLANGEVRDGVLDGDLVVYGTGDPTLSDRFYASKTEVWSMLADSLAALGIQEIRGDVVGDASYFEGEGTAPGWQESYMNAWYAAPAGALSFNENIVTLYIRPAEQPGWRPRVQLVPGGEGIAIVNQATTVAGGPTRIQVDRAAYDGPIVIRGQIGTSSSGVWRAVPVADPARFAAAVLREVLGAKGIRVQGGIRSIHSAEDSPLTGRSVFAPAFDDATPLRVLAVHRSPRLLDILSVVNKRSHNLYAETILRTIGRVALGEGSRVGGARAIEYLIRCELGLDTLELDIVDGSGLSVLNRSSARTVIRLLDYMADSPFWSDYWETLPEAGASTAMGLRRMHRTAAAGNLRAKTGTIDRVSALSGYVRAANGERLAFSIISNNVPSTWRAKRVEDAIGARLAAFRRPVGEGSAPGPAVGGGVNDQGRALSAAPSSGPGTATADAGMAGAVAEPVSQPADASAEGAAGVREHVIRKGDTLEAIAKRYGTTVRALQDSNPGVNPRRLLPGSRLRLP